jgi:transposase-like protein
MPIAQLLKKQGRAPHVPLTDRVRNYPAAKWEIIPGVKHRRHKGLNNQAENSHQPTPRRERIVMPASSWLPAALSLQPPPFVSQHPTT